MAKNCMITGCVNPVFAKGYCRYHQRYRKDFKPYRYQRKSTGELAVFQQIWDERNHKSFLTGLTIGRFDVRCFAHIVAKKKAPILRLEKANIIILTPYEHWLYDQGTFEQRESYARKWGCDWSKIFKIKRMFEDALKELEL